MQVVFAPSSDSFFPTQEKDGPHEDEMSICNKTFATVHSLGALGLTESRKQPDA